MTQFESLDEDRQGSVSYHELCKALFPRQDWEHLDEIRTIEAVVLVQSHIRGFLARTRVQHFLREDGAAPAAQVGVEPLRRTGSKKSTRSGAFFVATKKAKPPVKRPAPVQASPTSAGMSAGLHFDAARMEALEKAVQRLTQLAEQLLEERSWREVNVGREEQL